ncbi:hypothetical protein BH11PSE11_BH11PSE11_05420 [soil metagenome]
MTRLRRLLSLVLFAAWLTTAGAAQQFVAVPPLSARVIDQVGMLEPTQRTNLENVLKEYETRTGNQIAILLMSSTAPEVIEQYSIRVAEAWKLGRKGVDDGVILVVAKDNPKGLRRLRIESGRGVQGTVTDAQSKHILEDVIAPHFRQNDYYGGLTAGVGALTRLLDQEHFPAPANRPSAQTETAQDGESGFGSGFTFLFILFIVGSMLMSRLGRSSNSFGNNGWGRTAGVILGSAIGSGLGRGGFSDGGGFSSGGGFSGGGGSFDGGGASGDW